MTPILLDFSQRLELALHAEIIGDVTAVAAPLKLQPLIVGAFARDLHLLYGYGIETQRQTEDLDLALAVPDWDAFGALQKRLIATARFRSSPAAPHRLRHHNDLPIDLVPFGSIETPQRRIHWPPSGEMVMDVFGFREAAVAACVVELAGGARTHVVSLAALALLKMVCWSERHYAAPRKGAHDLMLIMRNYLAAGNEGRLYDEFLEWTDEEGFDYELAGARMLGRDVRSLLDHGGAERIGKLLAEQADAATPARLPAEMAPSDPDRARALLDAMLGGLIEGGDR